MKATTQSSFQYIEQLTWLRGFAAFLVIVSHTLRGTEVRYGITDKASSNLLFSWLDLGSFGVVLFFALSGCTLYISNADKTGGARQIVHFYIKRFFRIWPAFVVSLIFYIGFRPLFSTLYLEPAGYWVEKQFLGRYSIYNLLSYITLTFNISGPGGIFNNAYWSLPVEFQYYIIFPVLVFSLKQTNIIGPVIIGAILYLLPRLGLVNFDNNSIFTLAFTFCGGVLIGNIYQKTAFQIRMLPSLFVLSTLLAMVSAIKNSYFILPAIPLISNKDVWYGGMAIVMVFIVLVTKYNINQKLKLFLAHYGTISYSVYLYHNLFVATSVLLIVQLGISNSYLRLLLTFFLTLFSSYVAGGISYRYVEKPFVRVGRRILL